jgi:sulfotransferase family protein
MGSGTTLVRLVLDSHEHIAIPRETGFMRAYDAHRFTPFKYAGRGWTKRLGWAPEELDEVMRELYDRLFMRYAEKHGKERWGEKTPLHTWHLEDMARVFPDAQFVGIIRHPSASIASNMNRFSLGLIKTGLHWSRYTGEIVRQAALIGDRFALIRYEDLVLRPEPLLRELLGWLGEPWSEAVLEHHAVQSARGGRRRVEGKSRADEAIDSARVDKWTRTLRADHQAWLVPRLGERARFFGYDIEQPGVAAPLSAGGASVVLGSEIDARIDEHPDLDLRTRPLAPIYDELYDPHEFMMLRREQFEHLTRPRGIRGVGVAIVKRFPLGLREVLIKLVRRTRAALGLRRRPRQV